MWSYKDLLYEVLEYGEDRPDRTGTGTKGVFGSTFRAHLQDGFPLLTTKKLHWPSIVHELLWFISGDTNTEYLRSNGITIWDEWADEEGDLGPIYGYQWRNWKHNRSTYIDQLSGVINSIKTNPYSRRHIVSAWNVGQLDEMRLPPCHMMYQFYVTTSGRLNCQMYQRSADLFLGVPYNIASYALLMTIVANITDLVPGELTIQFGDLHLYSNHLDQANEQLERVPRKPPQVIIRRKIHDIDDLAYDDIELLHYDAHPHIKAEISV